MTMNKQFWASTAIRAVRTVAQTSVALIGTNAVGISDVDWIGIASGAALAGVISVLTSVATGLPECPSE